MEDVIVISLLVGSSHRNQGLLLLGFKLILSCDNIWGLFLYISQKVKPRS